MIPSTKRTIWDEDSMYQAVEVSERIAQQLRCVGLAAQAETLQSNIDNLIVHSTPDAVYEYLVTCPNLFGRGHTNRHRYTRKCVYAFKCHIMPTIRERLLYDLEGLVSEPAHTFLVNMLFPYGKEEREDSSSKNAE